MGVPGEKVWYDGGVLRLGYACINTHLRALRPSVYTSRTCTRRTFEARGPTYVSRLLLDNTRDLLTVLEWNEAHAVRTFRISSNIVPWADRYTFETLPHWDDIVGALAAAGVYAREHGHRLSFHPGQFNVLASPREDVVANSLGDLEVHGRLMDLLGQPRSPLAKVNIHVGGVYGDKPAALDRFRRNFERLSDAVRARLTVENDDRPGGYSVADLLPLSRDLGVPIVFDYHHHRFCPGDMSERDAARAAAGTWGGVRPTFHYSEGETRAHSEVIFTLPDDHGLDVDLILESKGKELNVLRLISV